MVDPLSLVTAILTAVQLIRSAASTASQNKEKCLELAERVKNLGDVLPSFAHAAANDAATARVLERLKDAVGEALTLIQSCKSAGTFSGKYSSRKAGDLDSVDKRINNCIMDLSLINQARMNIGAAAGDGKVPAAQTGAHVDHHSSYYQAQGGGASTAHVASPPTPTLQHAWSTPPSYYQQPPPTPTLQHAWSTPPSYYQQPPPTPTLQHAWSTPPSYYQPPGYVQYVPAGPPHYAASPAPPGSNLSSYCTLPTVNKIIKRVFR